MDLNEANHVITKCAEMLNNLQEIGVIDLQVKRQLLPVMVGIVLKNEAVNADYTAP